MSKLSFSALLLIAASPAAALAQGVSATPPSRAQLLQEIATNFDRADKNNDDALSREELQAAQAESTRQQLAKAQQQLEQQFAQLDTDKNGQLSLAEFKAAVRAKPPAPDEALGRLDTNKDGKVSVAEFRAPPLALFDRIDANKDGTITPDEQRRASGR